MVALGGVAGGDIQLNSAEVFSSATQTWTALPNMTKIRDASPATCAVKLSDNKTHLIACGGFDGSFELDSCEICSI